MKRLWIFKTVADFVICVLWLVNCVLSRLLNDMTGFIVSTIGTLMFGAFAGYDLGKILVKDEQQSNQGEKTDD